jgi:hypothetical protein
MKIWLVKFLEKDSEISPDRTNKLHYMEQKIQKAVDLVNNSHIFQAIPEPHPFD